DIGHANQGNPVPAFGPHGSVGAVLTDGVGSLSGGDVSGKEAAGDDGSRLGLDAFIVVSKCAQSGTMRFGGIGHYVHDVASITEVAQLVQGEKRCAGKI